MATMKLEANIRNGEVAAVGAVAMKVLMKACFRVGAVGRGSCGGRAESRGKARMAEFGEDGKEMSRRSQVGI